MLSGTVMRRHTKPGPMNLRREAEALLSAIRGGPDFVPLLALMAAAVWAARAGTIQGQGFPLIGSTMSGLLWGSLYVGLYLAYGAAARQEEKSPGVVSRKLGLCLLLALLSTHLCRVLVPLVFQTASWEKLFYLRRLLPLMFAGLWCMVLLPRQTGMVARVLLRHRNFAPLPHLALLLFAAAVLVSWADLMFEWGGRSAVEGFLKSQIIRRDAWATNILILFCAYTLIFAITRRVAITLLLLSPPYAVLVLASLTKIKYMHSAVQPLDLIRIPEFVPLFSSFFGTKRSAGDGCCCCTLDLCFHDRREGPTVSDIECTAMGERRVVVDRPARVECPVIRGSRSHCQSKSPPARD